MKKILLALLLLTSFPLFSQKIEKDIIDEFTKNRIIHTSWVKFDKGYMAFRFKAIDNNTYLEYRYLSGNVIAIDKGAELLFIDSLNDRVYGLQSTDFIVASRGGAATGFAGSDAYGIRADFKGNMLFFARLLKKMRIYTTDGYMERDIKPKEAKKIQQLYLLFQKTISGECTNKK